MEKLESFKSGFINIVELCHDIDSKSFIDSVSALLEDVESLQTDDDMERALSLLDELLIHVNDLDEEFVEPYTETIIDINEMADDLRHDANSA